MTSINHPTLSDRRATGRGRRLFWTLLLVCGSIFFVSSTTGCAHRAGHGHGHSVRRGTTADANRIERHMNRGVQHEFRRAGATRSQRRQAEVVVADIAPDLALLHSEGGVLVDRLLHASRAPEIDSAEFDAIGAESAQLMERTTAEIVAAAEELASILTAEQRAKIGKRRGFWHGR